MFTAKNLKYIIKIISGNHWDYRSLSFLIVPYRCPNVYCIFIYIIKYRTAQKIIFQLVAVVFGAIFYRAVLTVALQLGLPSGYLKLLSAVLVIVAIASTNGAFRSKKRGRN